MITLRTSLAAAIAASVIASPSGAAVTPPIPTAKLQCSDTTARIRPAKCVQLPHDPLAPLSAGADLAHLRWRGWGSPSATAHGCDWAFHHYQNTCGRLPVTVKVYRIRHFGEGDAYYYTRLRERFPDGTSRVFDVQP